jgi:hypothetical protein
LILHHTSKKNKSNLFANSAALLFFLRSLASSSSPKRKSRKTKHSEIPGEQRKNNKRKYVVARSHYRPRATRHERIEQVKEGRQAVVVVVFIDDDVGRWESLTHTQIFLVSV